MIVLEITIIGIETWTTCSQESRSTCETSGFALQSRHGGDTSKSDFLDAEPGRPADRMPLMQQGLAFVLMRQEE